jgi:hypothetical protein
MSASPTRRWDYEIALLVWLAVCVSVFSSLLYFRRGDLLLYGDAVAHINIARRVLDSRTPGLLQLGTVWLPLPHLLMIPFLLSDWMWTTGIGGSLPSMLAYILGTAGIFRLVRGTLSSPAGNDIRARFAAWGAAGICAGNPNLIYLQATALTEPLYLALFIWSVVYFSEFVKQQDESSADSHATSSLMKCGWCLAAACLTRYDGWFLAVTMCVVAVWVVARRENSALHRPLRNFVLLAASAPLFWLSYNAIVYRNPLEFAIGPYSAKAIEQRTPGASHPGNHSLPVAFSYFLKSAEINLGAGNWQRLWIALALVGVLVQPIARFAGSRFKSVASSPELSHSVPTHSVRPPSWPLLLLWTPLAFYTLSVGYSGVPIFMPVWWPFSYYNVRYGLELLPAFAVFVPLAVCWLADPARARALRISLAAAALVFVAASYASIWHDPVCFREAWVNSRTRLAVERELAAYLKALPPDSSLLMYLGDHVGALQEAGISLRRVIYEGNHRTWKQPLDPGGLWERALANPAQYADFVIAFEGDPVFREVQKQGLTPLAVIHVSGQPQLTIYRARASAR